MKAIYQLLFKIVHSITPSYYKRDLLALSKIDKVIIGIKQWLTFKVLE